LFEALQQILVALTQLHAVAAYLGDA
jgi:hypothetical protein